MSLHIYCPHIREGEAHTWLVATLPVEVSSLDVECVCGEALALYSLPPVGTTATPTRLDEPNATSYRTPIERRGFKKVATASLALTTHPDACVGGRTEYAGDMRQNQKPAAKAVGGHVRE